MQIFRVALLLLGQRRGAAGNDLGNTIKFLRCTTSGIAGNGLSNTIKYLRRTTRQRPGHHDQETSDAQRAAPRATA
jgi:hypothetical protein